MIAPKDTDPAIDGIDWSEPHYVAFSASTPSRGRLFLFLPSVNNVATDHRLISDQGARNGFHVVSLRYPNLAGIITFYADESVLMQTFDGTDRGAAAFTHVSRTNTNRANSIENRLLKLLAYLEAAHPNEGWGTFIDGSTPKWRSIVAAGQSLGGNYASLIARDHELARLAMFSAPIEHKKTAAGAREVGGSQPPRWLLGKHQTPSERYYQFGHARDEFTDWEAQWKAQKQGMKDWGPIVNVDNEGAPYGGSHLLITDARPEAPINPFGYPYFGCIARDDLTPKTAAGQPLFAPVWQYTCFA